MSPVPGEPDTPSVLASHPPSGPVLLTVGHGTLSRQELTGLLTEARVGTLVDVRRFPGSRRHPHVAREQLERWAPEAGIDYRWEPGLGGRRRLDPEQKDVDAWWRVTAFRAYAAYTRTDQFQHALDGLLDLVTDHGRAEGPDRPRVAVMCSEAVWWRCHRRIVSDVMVLLHDVPVLHLAHSGKLSPHPPAEGARVTADGLVYDRPAR